VGRSWFEHYLLDLVGFDCYCGLLKVDVMDCVAFSNLFVTIRASKSAEDISDGLIWHPLCFLFRAVYRSDLFGFMLYSSV
jgi:hypothetical protein